ncbi:uncharacterized protein EV422DRAFT_538682 [Fimicolochytrium jonesii]|uniref:uncharacterized protein n=1 Tax=Fimicolochytrium jonesii TaxID=1396493 RepID=UPI0022FEB940|nr:uncharacterized protein EV422DRAFT_538682 [Fimicolochytrium jonesii]KAI8818084.1 hypothetical protein EV422DRAFT_538682 [Fimicolochytrium jonesii]
MSFSRIATLRTPLAIHLATPVRAMSVRAAGGGFAKREITEEERYAWEQEKATIKKLREQLALKETEAKKKLDAAPHVDPEFHKELKDNKNVYGTGASGTDALSKREAASENRYIHDREAELKNKK